MLMKLNISCSIAFHFDVPGGEFQTCTVRLVWLANCCKQYFQSLLLLPLLEPLSQNRRTSLASGYSCFPRVSHHVVSEATANSAVLWSMPTETPPFFLRTSY